MDFVLGLDLDGVCADFYKRMRQIAAEWQGVKEDDLTDDVSYGLPEWGIDGPEYERLHRFAVTQRELFASMEPIQGAAQALRRLSAEEVRIRIITHRLFIRRFHHVAVSQTTKWLDHHGFPYWDLCFMKDKALVDADLYVEDSPAHIQNLQARGRKVIAFTNSTNRDVSAVLRADNWQQAEQTIREAYYDFRDGQNLPLPPAPGKPPPDAPVRDLAGDDAA